MNKTEGSQGRLKQRLLFSGLDQNPGVWVSAEERAKQMVQPASSSLSLPLLSLASAPSSLLAAYPDN